jgi:hypothetical protein
MVTKAKHSKRQSPELRVVFDTNVLFTGTASDLVQQEVANLIKESVFPDLKIQWYLPEMVCHERQFQMQKKALEMLPTIGKLERLLGHNLALTDEILIDSVGKAISRRQEELGLLKLALDQSRVDWKRVSLDSVYRKPPFRDGETEKGFRDCLVVESFLQLVADSPKTPEVCRIVLATGDKLLADTARVRTAGLSNILVISSLEELKGLINTLVSRVDEAFLAQLKPKAEKLFFVPKDESTFFFREHLQQKMRDKFAAELAMPPLGAAIRTNGMWLISPPNFVSKNRRRIQWASRIEVQAEASKAALQVPKLNSSVFTNVVQTPLGGNTVPVSSLGDPGGNQVSFDDFPSGNIALSKYLSVFPLQGSGNWGNNLEYASTPSVITTHKGIDTYEIIWATDVTTAGNLRNPLVEDLKHVEATWEPVA